MGAHAKLSPSSSKRWMTCPGSINLIESLGIEDKPSKYAAEGTVAHEVHEQCLLHNKDAYEFVGKTIKADGYTFKVTDPMADAIQTSLDYIRERIDDMESRGLDVEVRVEVKSHLKHLGIDGLDGGTSDVVLIGRKLDEIIEVEVIDYKHGQGVVVEVEHNSQAMCYALGIISEKDIIGDEIPGGVRLTIAQPRAHHPDGPIRSWDTTKEDLLDWQDNTLIPCAKATEDPDAPLVPSDDGCRFCLADGQCSALYKKTQELAIADFEDEKFPDPRTMTAVQKTVIMEHAAMIRSYIVAVENQIKLEVDGGSKEYEDHFKLVRTTTHRKFTEEAKDEIVSPLLDYLEIEDVFDLTPKMKGLGEIEKKLIKKLGKADAKELMSELTNKPEGQLVIAPLSDKRKGVQPSIISDFENLDD